MDSNLGNVDANPAWEIVEPPADQYGKIPERTLEFDSGFVDLPSGRVFSAQLQRGSELNLVLLHGVGSSHMAWLNVCEAISEDANLFLFDFPGFGQSPDGSGGIDTEYYSTIVDEYVDEIVSEKCVLVSHSMGSIVALDYLGSGSASKYVSGLVTTSGTMMSVLDLYHEPVRALREHPGTVLAYALQILGSSIPVPDWLAYWLLSRSIVRSALLGKHVASPDLLDESSLRRFADSLGGVSRIQAAMNGFGYDFRRVYEAIDAPVRIINGAEDGLVTLKDVEAFIEIASSEDISVTVIQNVGHWPTEEQCNYYGELLEKLARSLV